MVTLKKFKSLWNVVFISKSVNLIICIVGTPLRTGNHFEYKTQKVKHKRNRKGHWNLMLQKFEKKKTLFWPDKRNWRKDLAPTTIGGHFGVRLVAAIIVYQGLVILCACSLYQVSYGSAWITLSTSRSIKQIL